MYDKFTLHFLNDSIFNHIDHQVSVTSTEKYTCCSYKLPMNLFTFGRFQLFLPFIVIAPPISIDDVGFSGDISALIGDLKKSKSKFSLFPTLFLFLNLREEHLKGLWEAEHRFGVGNTLGSCIFSNGNPQTGEKFQSFSEYKSTLRSGYRRRILKAEKKGQCLQVEKIDNAQFDEKLHRLYLQVLAHNIKYKLETLPLSFFQNSLCDIYVWKKETQPLAFVMISEEETETHFIFGGLDYEQRDTFDLYYNMLLFILDKGIENRSNCIHFGQTAEETKCRLGCDCASRYMLCFTTNPVLNVIIEKSLKLFENRKGELQFHVFKGDEK